VSEFKIIEHNKIDFKKWDKTVMNSPLPLVFAQSFYLNATCPNWKALIKNDYEIVLPITEGQKLKIKYLYQPSFTPQLGIYGKSTKSDQEEIISFLMSQFKFIEIELNAFNLLKGKGFKEKPTFVIDFKKSFKQNENTKRNISKAKKNGIIVEEIKDFHEGIKFAKNKLIPWMKTELNISLKQGVLLLNLISNTNDNKALKAFKAIDENGKILSVGYFIYNQFHAVFLKGMSINKKDNTGSMHLLMDHAINYFKDKANIFDFGGGSSSGLANFYRGLGGSELIYHTLKVNNLPWPLKILKK